MPTTRRAAAPKRGSAAARPATLDALATLVHTLRALHLAGGGRQPWLALDLSMAQFKTVLLLVFTGGMTSRRLADQLGVGPSAISQLVDRLVQQKLARRVADDADRRVSWIRPTAKAMAMQESLMQTSRSLLADLVAGLSASEHAMVQPALTLLNERAQQALRARRP